jgi:hypothetical protein
LALGKSATQSSTLSYHDILPVAGYAVDGNTDGYFLNKSTTYTKYEQARAKLMSAAWTVVNKAVRNAVTNKTRLKNLLVWDDVYIIFRLSING